MNELIRFLMLWSVIDTIDGLLIMIVKNGYELDDSLYQELPTKHGNP